MTGATITTKAVTQAVNQAVEKVLYRERGHNGGSQKERKPLEGIYKKVSSGKIPVLRLVLGCCATLAVTTAASNAIGMGAATTLCWSAPTL